MATKRVLNRISVTKIAAVDRPCQEHATVAIIKRAPDISKLSPHYPLIKATFDEALNGAMVSERVNRAFWDTFDGLWQRNDAFRTALTDELSDGGDGSTASTDYVASVNELVDRAVAAARSAGSKSSDDEMSKAIQKAATGWIESQPQPKEPTMTITTKAALASAVASFAIAKSTAQEAQDIIEAADTLDDFDALDANPDLAKMAADKKKKKGEKDEMDAMKRQIAILEMPADVRKYYDGLADDATKSAFIAKSADDRATEVTKANEGDPVLYKCADGTEIRKSDGAVAAMMAKRMDAQAEEIKKLREENATGTIEKRAAAYPNVAKAISTEMLKSADQLGADSDAAKGILKSLEQMNKAGGSMMKSLGTTEGGEGPTDLAKARQTYDAAVAKVAAERKISKTAAMSAVRDEQPEIFAEAYPENAEMDAAE
ncbi:MAG: hypothetical protein Tp170SUR191951_107 [Prokaryotic dsDNA virus sp.]|mgnify:CR=1 FL=1|nr:hypothetical protein [Pseudomonas sp.]QDP55269.1 MAG: hypothetical protein Tp170SUR191951_107 [Prokaryotic dsDNA virus sp.]|tara:strand:+ start:61 stop:1353 length:1293 start_codon:yes stop_codon:yes gene_type:complete